MFASADRGTSDRRAVAESAPLAGLAVPVASAFEATAGPSVARVSIGPNSDSTALNSVGRLESIGRHLPYALQTRFPDGPCWSHRFLPLFLFPVLYPWVSPVSRVRFNNSILFKMPLRAHCRPIKRHRIFHSSRCVCVSVFCVCVRTLRSVSPIKSFFQNRKK